MLFAAIETVPVQVGLPELGLVAFASAIIFAILGPRLLREIREGKYK